MKHPSSHPPLIRALAFALALSGSCDIAARASDAEPTQKPAYPVPEWGEITRIGHGTEGSPSAEERRQALYFWHTNPHPVAEEGTLFLTDQPEEAVISALRDLSHLRGRAAVLRHPDFATLLGDGGAARRGHLAQAIAELAPRYVALVPRWENFREEVHLALLEVLTRLDSDPQLDTFPSYLVAREPASLASRLRRLTEPEATPPQALLPMVVCQFTEREWRSQQKAVLLDRYFEARGAAMPSLTLRSGEAAEGLALSVVGDEDDWRIGSGTRARGTRLRQIPEPASAALDASTLALFFGHGTPGSVCGVSTDVFHATDWQGKVVLLGNCFAAMPDRSDFPALQQGPDGARVDPDRERFAFAAWEGGADGVLAHLRLSNGFPTLFPVCDDLVAGRSLGESYQRLLNAYLGLNPLPQDKFPLSEALQPGQAAAQRRSPLLWVVLGDPAWKPFAPSSLSER